MGQRIAGAMTGGPSFAWTPYLILWLGLIAGAATGAIAFTHFGFMCVWFAAGAAAALGVVRLYLRDA